MACCTLLIAAAFSATPVAADQPLGYDRLSNPDGAGGSTAGWQDSGFVATQFGSSPTVPPANAFPAEDTGSNWLFQATETGNTMTQTANFNDMAGSVDAGTAAPVGISAYLGGSGNGDDGVKLVAQPADAHGQPIGAAVTLGPPTATDRGGAAAMDECKATFTPPVGMRTIRVTLLATGAQGKASTGTATAISVNDPVISDTVLVPLVPAEGQNCWLLAPAGAPGTTTVGAGTTTTGIGVTTAPGPGTSPSTTDSVSPATPSVPTIEAALRRILAAPACASSVRRIARQRGCRLRAAAPAAGALRLQWLVTVHGRRRIIVATAHAYRRSGQASLYLRLNREGTRVFGAAPSHMTISERASFTLVSGRTVAASRKVTLRG